MSTPETDGSERRPPAPAPLWVRGLPAAIGVLSVVLVVLVVALLRHDGGGDDGSATASAGATTAQAPPPPPELPRGGRRLLPDYRVVTFAGAPQDPELGELGVGSSLRGAVGRLEKQARVYRRKTRPEQPALQLISTVVHAAPGPDGQFNMHQSRATIARHLREARRAKALLILDVQPGRASFVAETKRLARWLREPDVALALDPEWRMERAGQIPGQVIGSVGARELQRSLDVVAGIVREHDLPPKMVLVHRFTEDMVRGLERVRVPRQVQAVMSIDGVGDRANKVAKYRQLTRDLPRAWRPGFKLFYREDREAGGLMTPKQVIALQPRPQVVMYE
ncbi:hypothetical protein [Patulibacter sp. SYSU D01012]|uniref:hypothetical protein n=1 Tax=Patulibacter sp. SYSU D01012 TaxID=2817381 RepID=UPI001B307511|nr:hypothetical protein [Patulibacter sp. SYSU D01012]